MESSPNVTRRTAQCSPLLSSTPVEELPSVVNKLPRSNTDIWLTNKKRIKKLRISAYSTNNSRREDLQTTYLCVQHQQQSKRGSANYVSLRTAPTTVEERICKLRISAYSTNNSRREDLQTTYLCVQHQQQSKRGSANYVSLRTAPTTVEERICKLRISAYSTNNSRREDLQTTYLCIQHQQQSKRGSANYVSLRTAPTTVEERICKLRISAYSTNNSRREDLQTMYLCVQHQQQSKRGSANYASLRTAPTTVEERICKLRISAYSTNNSRREDLQTTYLCVQHQQQSKRGSANFVSLRTAPTTVEERICKLRISAYSTNNSRREDLQTTYLCVQHQQQSKRGSANYVSLRTAPTTVEGRICKLRISAYSTNNSRREDLQTSENTVNMRTSAREVIYDNFFFPSISYRPRYLRYSPVKKQI